MSCRVSLSSVDTCTSCARSGRLKSSISTLSAYLHRRWRSSDEAVEEEAVEVGGSGWKDASTYVVCVCGGRVLVRVWACVRECACAVRVWVVDGYCIRI